MSTQYGKKHTGGLLGGGTTTASPNTSLMQLVKIETPEGPDREFVVKSGNTTPVGKGSSGGSGTSARGNTSNYAYDTVQKNATRKEEYPSTGDVAGSGIVVGSTGSVSTLGAVPYLDSVGTGVATSGNIGENILIGTAIQLKGKIPWLWNGGGSNTTEKAIVVDPELTERAARVGDETGQQATDVGSSADNLPSLLGGVRNFLKKVSKDCSDASSRTANATRTGTEAMVNRDISAKNNFDGVEVPNLTDPNDPSARQLRDINTDLTEDTSSDKQVSAGDKDTKKQKLDDKSKIADAQKMQNVDNNKDTEEQKFDDKSSVDKKKKLDDINTPEGIDEQILRGFDDLDKKDLYNIYDEAETDEQAYNGKSSIIGTSLRNIAKAGGTQQQKINDSSLITPEELASIVKGSLDDFNALDSNSNNDRPVILDDIDGSGENNQDSTINKDTLEEVTDALAGFGSDGDMVSDLDKAVGDLGMLGESGISDLASSIASDVVSSELGK